MQTLVFWKALYQICSVFTGADSNLLLVARTCR